MNKKRLKRLEKLFLETYPDGFFDPKMRKISKKHNLGKLVDYIHEVCSQENLQKGANAFPDVVKVISKSSMVSVFEKMRFRDFCSELDEIERIEFIDAISELIHGNEKLGFNRLVRILAPYKLDKWTLITCWRAYYNASYDVFVKPTTVKKIIDHLELEDCVYSPKVTYGFYRKYRIQINKMKELIKEESLKPSNPAFSGFLMMTIK